MKKNKRQSKITKELQQLSDEPMHERTVRDEKSIIDEFETQISANEPVRELWSNKNIKFKTEITEEQRGVISILLDAYQEFKHYNIDLTVLRQVLSEFVDFGVAIDRKGRTEYVEAHKIYNQQNQQSQQQQGNSINNQMNQMKM